MSDPIQTSEEYARYLREVVVPRCEAVLADPFNVVTAEELEASCREWDLEDGIGEEHRKQSA